MEIQDVIIIGGGPAGYTAALYAAAAGLKTLVLERSQVGGQMAQSGRVENYPGFPDGIAGQTLGEQMKAGAEKHGAVTSMEQATKISRAAPHWIVHTEEADYSGKTVILAVGADPKRLDIPGEYALQGKGVSYCAAIDGALCEGKTAVVIGGGNTAVSDAIQLSGTCRKVYLIHHGTTFRCTNILYGTLTELTNVEIIRNSKAIWLHGTDALNACTIQDLRTACLQKILCDGVFIAIGRQPASEPFRSLVDTSPSGYIRTDTSLRTNQPGIFAAGDVREKDLRQIVSAVSDGAIAARSAGQYLRENFMNDS